MLKRSLNDISHWTIQFIALGVVLHQDLTGPTSELFESKDPFLSTLMKSEPAVRQRRAIGERIFHEPLMGLGNGNRMKTISKCTRND